QFLRASHLDWAWAGSKRIIHALLGEAWGEGNAYKNHAWINAVDVSVARRHKEMREETAASAAGVDWISMSSYSFAIAAVQRRVSSGATSGCRAPNSATHSGETTNAPRSDSSPPTASPKLCCKRTGSRCNAPAASRERMSKSFG